jgi:hypothetical protein
MHIKDKTAQCSWWMLQTPESCINLTIKLKNQKQRLITE